MAHTSESLRDAFHYLYPAELPVLKELARSLPDNPHVVNIGAGAGTSGLAFLESRPDLILTTIDIQEGDSPLGCLYAERQVGQAAGFKLNERWFQICARSQEVAEYWVEPVDMVFIDGDHSYVGCTEDIWGWVAHIKSGGILAIHDYRKGDLKESPDGPHPMQWVEVDLAVGDFIGNYKPEIIVHVDSLIAFRVR